MYELVSFSLDDIREMSWALAVEGYMILLAPVMLVSFGPGIQKWHLARMLDRWVASFD